MSKPFQIQSTTERLAGWAPIFQKFEDSGLSQRKFCQQEKLNFATFTKWYQLRNQLDKARLAQQGTFNVIFDLSGGVYDPVTRQFLGSLTR